MGSGAVVVRSNRTAADDDAAGKLRAVSSAPVRSSAIKRMVVIETDGVSPFLPMDGNRDRGNDLSLEARSAQRAISRGQARSSVIS